jgi:hypothetical protein
MISNRKAALDLSIGTIVIVVIGVTMLILGMVLVRSIMCQAIGLTTDVNGKVTAELDRYFGATGGEVVCIGSGNDAVKMQADSTNNVFCSIRAPQTAEYEINLVNHMSFIDTLDEDRLKQWIRQSTWKNNVAPGDQTVKKVITLNIPDNAPEGQVRFTVEIKKDGELISTQDLDFDISRTGAVQNLVC